MLFETQEMIGMVQRADCEEGDSYVEVESGDVRGSGGDARTVEKSRKSETKR